MNAGWDWGVMRSEVVEPMKLWGHEFMSLWGHVARKVIKSCEHEVSELWDYGVMKS